MSKARRQQAVGLSSSLARNSAVIEISTNNTRIHHSHGNITQSYTVHVSCASTGGDEAGSKLDFYRQFFEAFYDFCIAFQRPLGPTSMLITTLAQTVSPDADFELTLAR